MIASLRAIGPQRPLIAVEHQDHFEIIDGGRRLTALEEAGWTWVPLLLIEPHQAEFARHINSG